MVRPDKGEPVPMPQGADKSSVPAPSPETPKPGVKYYIQSNVSQLFLAVADKNHGGRVTQAARSPAQTWELIPAAPRGYYYIRSSVSGWHLDVFSGNPIVGQRVVQAKLDPKQVWTLIPAEKKGCFYIKTWLKRDQDLFLDVRDGDRRVGADLCIARKHGEQVWAFWAATRKEGKRVPQGPDENGVAAALEKVGARIRRDEKRPGKPVVWVDLTYKTKVTDADLKGLKNLKSLQTLNLGATRVTDACLKEVKDLKDLQALQVPLTQVTDAGLKNLKNLQSLQLLNLAGTRVTDAGLKHLKGLKKLRLLDLTATRVTDRGIKNLKDLKNLHWLRLGRTPVTDAGLKELNKALPRCRIDK
jgi:hypothetical protein